MSYYRLSLFLLLQSSNWLLESQMFYHKYSAIPLIFGDPLKTSNVLPFIIWLVSCQSISIVFSFVNTNLLLKSLVPDRISTEILVYFEGKLNGTIDVVEVHRSRFTVVLSSRVLLEIFLSLATNINGISLDFFKQLRSWNQVVIQTG